MSAEAATSGLEDATHFDLWTSLYGFVKLRLNKTIIDLNEVAKVCKYPVNLFREIYLTKEIPTAVNQTLQDLKKLQEDID